MPRARTGTLVPPDVGGLWRARITTMRPDGTKTRPFYSLGTSDKALARRKLVRLVAALERGDDVVDAPENGGSHERVRDYADAWLTKREAQGVGMAKKERSTLEMYAFEAIGRLPLGDVRPSHVRSILGKAVAQGLKRATVAHVRGALRRLFASALTDELVDVNPVAAVRVPRMREVRRQRTILTDAEFAKFVGCADVDLEIRMLGLVARCEGGMRTGDLHRWDWTMIDQRHLAECTIPRAKTRTPQVLAIPAMLAPFLRAWWQRAGTPESGPVFPVRTGKRTGEAKRPLNSYAKRLRRELFRAGVARRLLESTGREDSRRARDVSLSENAFATPGIVLSRDDSTETDTTAQRGAPVSPRLYEAFSAPAAGLEPATRRLTAACSTN
jgi:integrase